MQFKEEKMNISADNTQHYLALIRKNETTKCLNYHSPKWNLRFKEADDNNTERVEFNQST